MKQLFTLFCLLPIMAFAQVYDDFSDGNFLENPPWTGDVEIFIINGNNILQLNDEAAGESGLLTNNSLGINCEWRFWVKMSFSPSSNNYGRIYLLAENAEFVNLGTGYFLQLGESGSNDALELFRQDGDEKISVCRGQEGLISSSFELGIKITRSAEGLWQIFADESGGENYIFQSEGLDNTYQNTSIFGIYCKYTSSNSNKFYFDNIYVGDIYVDTEPPILNEVIVLNDSNLQLVFDEVIDIASAENIINYSVSNQIGNPISAVINETDHSRVGLQFEKNFINGEQNIISAENISDIYGNVASSQQMGFMFFEAQENDILINEIMADPNPVVGLPDYEYLEIRNLLPYAINLSSWELQIGSSVKLFENVEIKANGYLILAKSDAEELLNIYGDFYGFSSFSLTNSGQDILLFSPNRNLISSVSYTVDWYDDEEKMLGGWSLEMINPENICSGSENWTASNNSLGGSPGSENSVNSDIKYFPRPTKLEVLDNKKIQLRFNQGMDSISSSDINKYAVNQQVGNPTTTYFSGFKPDRVILNFENEFNTGTIYDLKIKKTLKNCNQQEMQSDTTIVFGVAEIPGNQDVIINEILFNPLTDGVDFVELYNNSFKVVDLSFLKIASIKTTPPNPPDTSIYNVSADSYLLLPGDYVCISSSPQTVKSQYFTKNPFNFVKTSPFPSFNNDQGIVMILDENLQIIDDFNYSEEMHFPLLNYFDGVSLERLSFLSPSNDAQNWHSAAESVGFATPAYANSQSLMLDGNDEINIEPEIFSPDNDGFNDVVGISYSFSQEGYMLNIDVYNAAGYPIRKLVNNKYIGNMGSIFWDGIQDDSSKAPVGIYVFYIQVFDLDGNTKKYTKTCVLASQL